MTMTSLRFALLASASMALAPAALMAQSTADLIELIDSNKGPFFLPCAHARSCQTIHCTGKPRSIVCVRALDVGLCEA